MDKKKIKIIDSVLIIASVLFLASFVTYARPLVIAPIDNFETTNSSILFEFERGSVILIDDNPEFSSPREIHAKNNLIINLKPGKYYWKIDGVIDSKVREFEVISEVNLKMEKSGDKYRIVNAGNAEVEVEVYEEEELVGNVLLEVNEEKKLTGTAFVGRSI